jgi:hypothetical protein
MTAGEGIPDDGHRDDPGDRCTGLAGAVGLGGLLEE